MDTISGRTLIEWGFNPGPWFPAAIASANEALAAGGDPRAAVEALAPPPPLPLQDGAPFHLNIHAEAPDEEVNVAAVVEAMRALMRVPTVKAGAVMPERLAEAVPRSEGGEATGG